MRSLCRWLIMMSVLGCMIGCCKNPELKESQTPVKIHGAQRLQVRPMAGGESRTVLVPDGFVVVDPPPSLQPELRR
jgi:hypothetical protein